MKITTEAELCEVCKKPTLRETIPCIVCGRAMADDHYHQYHSMFGNICPVCKRELQCMFDRYRKTIDSYVSGKKSDLDRNVDIYKNKKAEQFLIEAKRRIIALEETEHN